MYWLFAIVLLLLIIAPILILPGRHLEEEGLPKYDPTEYHRAHAAYQQAQANFQQAEPQYIDIAISDLGISENRVDNELRKLRQGGA